MKQVCSYHIKYQVSNYGLTEFELRASHLLDSHSTALSHVSSCSKILFLKNLSLQCKLERLKLELKAINRSYVLPSPKPY
jgi:hypothetical protein